MHQIKVNNDKNRLYLKLSGNVDYRESRTILNEVISKLENLQPGFDMISNLSTYVPISQTADITISAILKTVKEHGVRKTIRIVEDPDSFVGFGLKLLAEDAGFRHLEIAHSISEAEQILE